MTTKNPSVSIDERRNAELYRPTAEQYLIGACWGLLLVLCVCAEALETMLS